MGNTAVFRSSSASSSSSSAAASASAASAAASAASAAVPVRESLRLLSASSRDSQGDKGRPAAAPSSLPTTSEHLDARSSSLSSLAAATAATAATLAVSSAGSSIASPTIVSPTSALSPVLAHTTILSPSSATTTFASLPTSPTNINVSASTTTTTTTTTTHPLLPLAAPPSPRHAAVVATYASTSPRSPLARSANATDAAPATPLSVVASLRRPFPPPFAFPYIAQPSTVGHSQAAAYYNDECGSSRAVAYPLHHQAEISSALDQLHDRDTDSTPLHSVARYDHLHDHVEDLSTHVSELDTPTYSRIVDATLTYRDSSPDYAHLHLHAPFASLHEPSSGVASNAIRRQSVHHSSTTPTHPRTQLLSTSSASTSTPVDVLAPGSTVVTSSAPRRSIQPLHSFRLRSRASSVVEPSSQQRLNPHAVVIVNPTTHANNSNNNIVSSSASTPSTVACQPIAMSFPPPPPPPPQRAFENAASLIISTAPPPPPSAAPSTFSASSTDTPVSAVSIPSSHSPLHAAVAAAAAPPSPLHPSSLSPVATAPLSLSSTAPAGLLASPARSSPFSPSSPPPVFSQSPSEQQRALPVEYPPGMSGPRGPRNRRSSVSAESDRTQLTPVKRVFLPKTPEQLGRIRQVMRANLLFSSLDEEQQQEIINNMSELNVSPGQDIIRQNESADFFYVIDHGTFDVFKMMPSASGEAVKVFEYVNQGSFGELALMYNCPRAATVRARTAGKLWRVDRETFRLIIIQSTERKRKMYEQVLESVPLLANLSKQERALVADSLEPVTFKAGDYVIRQGEIGESVFFIIKGAAIATQTPKEGVATEVEVGRIAEGGYFGERSLLTREPRAANVIALAAPLVCACMDRSAFERLMGNVKDIMQRQIDGYRNAQQVLDQPHQPPSGSASSTSSSSSSSSSAAAAVSASSSSAPSSHPQPLPS